MLIIAPSILAANFTALGSDIIRVADAGAKHLHIDIMDGNFVPNITFGPVIVRAIRSITDIVLDVHLMIDRPERYIKDFANAGANILTIHAESTRDPAGVLRDIRALGVKPAIAVKPKTAISEIYEFLPLCDMVLIMTVEPGFGGQTLIPETLDKIAPLKAELERLSLSTDIEVDGGINHDNVGDVIARGANIIVAGSAIFHAPDAAAAISAMLCAGK